MPVTLRLPNTPGEAGEAGTSLPLDGFMGKWHVVWSTLPLWKDKKDVHITYTTLPSSPNNPIKFDDLVEYKKQSASHGSSPSTVKGTDTLDLTSPNPLTFDWRGKGLLFFVTSRWQVIGSGFLDDGDEGVGRREDGNGEEREGRQVEWAVTFFSKTTFTPQGIDIYLRSALPARAPSPALTLDDSAPMPNEPQAQWKLLDEIVKALEGLGGDVGELAKGGFVVGEKVA